ncbi:MAG: recombinase family protein [Leptolyngbyaceae cyanobacterium]
MTNPQVASNLTRTEPARKMKLGYGRVSTENEGQTTSIEAQQRRLKEYGCNEIFLDRASGGSLNRPNMQRLRKRASELAKLGPVEVVVTAPERLSRDQIELISLIGEFEKAGIVVHSLDAGGMSVDDPDKKLTWSILGSTYEFQRNNSKRKIRERKDRDRKQCRRMGSNAHFGYRWNDTNTKRLPDPDKWPIAREIVTRYLNGEGLPTLVRWLRDSHSIERTTTGLYSWLKSDAIRGHTSHRFVAGEKKREVFYNTHTPLITLSEDKALRLRFQSNKRHSGKRKIRAVSGLCRCVSCRYVLSLCDDGRPRKNGKQYYYFRCKGKRSKGLKCPESGTIPYTSVEPLILEAICKRAADIAAAVVEPEEKKENPKILKLREDLRQLETMHADNQRSSIAEAINDIQREIIDLQSFKEQYQADQQQLDELVQAIATPTFWDGLGEEERNQIYQELRVVVWCCGREIISVEVDRKL